MNQINFQVSIDTEDKATLLAFSELFANLAGKTSVKGNVEVEADLTEKTEKPKAKKAKEPVKVEPEKKQDPVKVEPEKTETKESQSELTMEYLREKGSTLAKADPTLKARIRGWLNQNGVKSVPEIPEDLFADYNKFLDSLS